MPPANPTYARDYGVWAHVFLIIAAFVSADHFQKTRFGLSAFLALSVLNLAVGAPFIFATFGLSIGPPEVFAAVSVYAFLLSHLSFGLLGGGIVALVVSSLRKPE